MRNINRWREREIYIKRDRGRQTDKERKRHIEREKKDLVRDVNRGS